MMKFCNLILMFMSECWISLCTCIGMISTTALDFISIFLTTLCTTELREASVKNEYYLAGNHSTLRKRCWWLRPVGWSWRWTYVGRLEFSLEGNSNKTCWCWYGNIKGQEGTKEKSYVCDVIIWVNGSRFIQWQKLVCGRNVTLRCWWDSPPPTLHVK